MLEHPGALFVIDSSKEEIAIAEAQKLKIPIVAVVDTNGDPENIDYPIPGNDDAVRAIELFTMKITDAIMEGKKKKIDKELQEAKQEDEAGETDEADKIEETPAEEAQVESHEEAPLKEEKPTDSKEPVESTKEGNSK